MTAPELNQTHPVLTVTQLTQAIKMSLESTFSFVCIQGEISNFKHQTSGHFYFSLKDQYAQISAVMFQADAKTLKILPKSGDQVVVKGEINVYAPKGNYQLIVRELSYVGLGLLLLKLEELKIKLHKLGWFKADRKKPLPKLPRRIGVVTSPTGAVIQDILNVLTRRFSGFHLILNPVKVQGEGAAEEIAKAIRQFNDYNLADVLIVGRGGGSLEDLFAFNEEVVAEAIYNSRIPIISAVGHETDHCIADYVADIRAPTPSAAAEIVIAEKNQYQNHLQTMGKRLAQTVMHMISKDRHRLQGIMRHPLLKNPRLLIESRYLQLDDMKERVDAAISIQLEKRKSRIAAFAKQVQSLNPIKQISHFKQKLSQCDKSIQKEIKFKISMHKERLKKLIILLEAIDPKNLLKKGYSILFSEKDHSVITSIRDVQKNEQGRLLLSDGETIVTFNEIINCER